MSKMGFWAKADKNTGKKCGHDHYCNNKSFYKGYHYLTELVVSFTGKILTAGKNDRFSGFK